MQGTQYRNEKNLTRLQIQKQNDIEYVIFLYFQIWLGEITRYDEWIEDRWEDRWTERMMNNEPTGVRLGYEDD